MVEYQNIYTKIKKNEKIKYHGNIFLINNKNI